MSCKSSPIASVIVNITAVNPLTHLNFTRLQRLKAVAYQLINRMINCIISKISKIASFPVLPHELVNEGTKRTS